MKQPLTNVSLNSNEELILSSDNKELILTSQRIIQSNSDGIKSLDLKDYAGFEVIKKQSKYYLIVAIVIGVIYLILFAKGLDNTNNFTRITDRGLLFLIAIPLFPLFLWYRDRKKYVRLIGKFNTIEFLAQRMSQQNIDKLITRIQEAKDKLYK